MSKKKFKNDKIKIIKKVLKLNPKLTLKLIRNILLLDSNIEISISTLSKIKRKIY